MNGSETINNVDLNGGKCPHCGASLKPGVSFCGSCGGNLKNGVHKKDSSQTLPAMKVCPQCGSPVREGSPFCSSCGSKMRSGSPDRRPARGS